MKKNKKDKIEDDKIINIKIENKEQAISPFSYDENDKLNSDLSEFIIDKSKGVRMRQEIQLNIFTDAPLRKEEMQVTICNHFAQELEEGKRELRKTNIFSLVMLLLGIGTFAILATLYNSGFSNFYFESILEIAAWVFVWEAIDSIFLERPKVRRRKIQMQKLSSAKVEILSATKKEK